MAKKTPKKMLKGNRLWPINYALTSLTNYKVRNIGIALILAISVAIPTTVFAWTDTGTRLTIEDYFNDNAYQFSVQNIPGNLDYSHLFTAQELLDTHPYVKYMHITPSTVGILRVDGITPEWEAYRIGATNYAFGIKDGRVISVTPEILDVWKSELSYDGNFTLTSGEIIVSKRFRDSAFDVSSGLIDIQIGTEIGIDVLRNRYEPTGARPFDPLLLDRQIIRNLTVVGIYDVLKPSVVAMSYPSVYRPNYDILEPATGVLGLTDAVLILEDDLGEETIEKITAKGYFSPVGFVRGSAEGLITAGPALAAIHMLSLKTYVEESDDQLSVVGLDNIEKLQTHISTYLASQILIVLAVPLMVMSLMLTIFTSETSVSQKKGEISALRAKGASFNQIFAGFIWEAMILSFLGFVTGILLTYLMSPLMGSSTGLLTFDSVRYDRFLFSLVIPGQALALAGAIAMFLPAAYLVHVSRRIDVTEIGQPTSRSTYEIPEDVDIKFYVLGLGLVLTILVVVPALINPTNQTALYLILLSTIMLFAASYLGSRAMRLATANASEKVSRIMGEKKLYLTQSLRRRKGQFIPLLVILTLTLTTTTMMLIQTASFEDTLINEASYAMGADVRVYTSPKILNWSQGFTNSQGVETATPIIQTLSYIDNEAFYLEGLDIAAYRELGVFKQSSFIGISSDTVLTHLEQTENGIIISKYYATRYNVTIGDTLQVRSTGTFGQVFITFEIVGLMQSAPGFGMASTRDLQGTPYGAYFDFQPGRGGFALVNSDYLANVTGITQTRTFLFGITSLEEANGFIEELEKLSYTTIYTPESIEFGPDTVTGLFLAGIQGLTMISYIMCAAMAIASIALFLGSAVLEREPEYALFRAIGATKRQVVSLVFGEFAGSVLAAVVLSLLLGVVFGFTAILLTFGISSIWPILGKILTFPLYVMFITITIECVAMIIACFYPARRAGRTNPAEVLRNM
ncbi:ABC transporter permease [Candidatus Thorarchaeota archaeon]|nr:MAG: ABC transporter permease [Candidatus Thorarchaeota archaeon]